MTKTTEETLIILQSLRDEVHLARRAWRSTRLALVAVVVIGAGFFYNDWRDDLRDCERSNQSREAISAGFDQFRDALINASSAPPTPERQAAIDNFNRDIDENILAKLEPREC